MTDRKTVYLVSQGSYSSERTVGIFSTKAKAEAFMVLAKSEGNLTFDDFNDIQEWVLDARSRERLLFQAVSDTFERTRQAKTNERYSGSESSREHVTAVLRDPTLPAREVEFCETGQGPDDTWERFTAYAPTAEGALQALRQLRSETEATKAGIA